MIRGGRLTCLDPPTAPCPQLGRAERGPQGVLGVGTTTVHHSSMEMDCGRLVGCWCRRRPLESSSQSPHVCSMNVPMSRPPEAED